MFGLFKNLTPEGRLENDIKQALEKQIAMYLRESSKNEFLMGIAIDSATRDVYKSYILTANLLARGHGITNEKALAIITKATNDIRNKYLVNSPPIS